MKMQTQEKCMEKIEREKEKRNASNSNISRNFKVDILRKFMLIIMCKIKCLHLLGNNWCFRNPFKKHIYVYRNENRK